MLASRKGNNIQPNSTRTHISKNKRWMDNRYIWSFFKRIGCLSLSANCCPKHFSILKNLESNSSSLSIALFSLTIFWLPGKSCLINNIHQVSIAAPFHRLVLRVLLWLLFQTSFDDGIHLHHYFLNSYTAGLVAVPNYHHPPTFRASYEPREDRKSIPMILWVQHPCWTVNSHLFLANTSSDPSPPFSLLFFSFL